MQDYYGFPPAAYELTYAAPGSAELALRTAELLRCATVAFLLGCSVHQAASHAQVRRQAGIKSTQDSERGYDHGVFVPLSQVWPDADVSLAVLSLDTSHDPEVGPQLRSVHRGSLPYKLHVAGECDLPQLVLTPVLTLLVPLPCSVVTRVACSGAPAYGGGAGSSAGRGVRSCGIWADVPQPKGGIQRGSPAVRSAAVVGPVLDGLTGQRACNVTTLGS